MNTTPNRSQGEFCLVIPFKARALSDNRVSSVLLKLKFLASHQDVAYMG